MSAPVVVPVSSVGQTVLDGSLHAQPVIDALISEAGPMLLTPDSDFIVWRRQNSDDHVIRVINAYDPAYGFYNWAAYRLDGTPATPAFDSTGEFMYVPVPESDEIQTFE